MITTGGDIDSYCTKCRLNLEHIVVAMVGGEVVKVKCKTCGGTHRYKSLNAATPRAPQRKTPRTTTYHINPQAVWETAMEQAGGPGRDYGISEVYREGEVVLHGTFGKGVVQKTQFRKCSVLFRDGERLLACGNG